MFLLSFLYSVASMLNVHNREEIRTTHLTPLTPVPGSQMAIAKIINMFSLRYLETVLLIFLLTSLHIEAKPLRKRTISEVQLMHNVREHKQVGERQVWLQEKLKGIIVSKPQRGQSLDIKNVFPNDVLGLDKRKR
ncbi:Parathyroid hormone%2C partial [Scomber scombrus]|uniref:Parathyroid hormone n=1 Tax=Scomber scombrus TaxID=13677 RepID=A0AAV1N8E2_SCOSC